MTESLTIIASQRVWYIWIDVQFHVSCFDIFRWRRKTKGNDEGICFFQHTIFFKHNSFDFSDALIAQGFKNFSLITIIKISAADNTSAGV